MIYDTKISFPIISSMFKTHRSWFVFQLQKAKEDAEEAYNTISEVAKKEVTGQNLCTCIIEMPENYM